MSEKTLGQIAYEAFTAVRYDGSLTTAWTHPSVAHKAWEATGQAVAAHVASPDAADYDSAAEIMRLREQLAQATSGSVSIDGQTFPQPTPGELELSELTAFRHLAQPAPELADAMAETARFRNWLDDFTHVVIDLGEARVVRAAERVRTKAGLPPVKP